MGRKHDGKGGAHAGTPSPGNPGYQPNTGGYSGRHESGGICGLIALPAAGAGLAALGAVLLAVWRAVA